MPIFHKILELIQAFFNLILALPEYALLSNFLIVFSFLFSILLIFYWFYLEKKEPIFKNTWKYRIQTAQEAKAGITIKDIEKELQKIINQAKENPFLAYKEVISLLDEFLFLLGYEDKDLSKKIEKITPLLLSQEDKNKILTLIDIRNKWDKKLKQNKDFTFPKEYLYKIFQESIVIFQKIKVISQESLQALLQALPFEESSDPHAKFPI